MNKRVKRVIMLILALVISVTGLWFLQRLVMPKYMHGIVEGAMIAEYYEENKDHDVIFIGDCEVYENISPAVLWQEYGINSYIRGSAQQLTWQSYYLLEEMLTYETPKVVVFNVLAMKYGEPQSEAYNRMTLDGMKWSSSKSEAVKVSMMEDENYVDYLFPLLRYHSRITELEEDDLTYFWNRDKVTFNGYYMRVDVKPAENVPEGKPLGSYEFGELAWEYLDKMVDLCNAKGVELVLMKAPSLYPYWYDQWEEQIEAYAKENNLKYYNFLEDIDEMGIDFTTDTYDAGLHLNLSGAEKLSAHIGKLLVKDCGLESRRGEEKLEKSWEEKLKAYNAEIERQKEGLEE